MCNHLPSQLEQLSLENSAIDDEQLLSLIMRCQRIEELDLRGCERITEVSLKNIACHLSSSLKKLALPDLFCLVIHQEKLKVLSKMEKLKFVWILLPGIPWVDLQKEIEFKEILEGIFPNFTINLPTNASDRKECIEGQFRDGPRIAENFIEQQTRLCHFKPKKPLKRRSCEEASGSLYNAKGKKK